MSLTQTIHFCFLISIFLLFYRNEENPGETKVVDTTTFKGMFMFFLGLNDTMNKFETS